MIHNFDKVVGFYVDAFGNEVDEYEMLYKYTVCYKGRVFEGDRDGWNEYNTDGLGEAMSLCRMLHNDGYKVYITDNEYDAYYDEVDGWSN